VVVKEFNIPYSDWDKVPYITKGDKIGFRELVQYLRQVDEELKKKMEKEEKRYKELQELKNIPSGRNIPSLPKRSRKYITLTSCVK